MIKRYLFIVIGAVFIISSVFIAIEASASGAEMRQLEEEESILMRQKSELEGTLVTGISVSEIEAKSGVLGYIKPSELIYLNANEGKDQALINTISR